MSVIFLRVYLFYMHRNSHENYQVPDYNNLVT